MYQKPKGNRPIKGPTHPPKKIKEITVESKSIFEYSPRKNKAKSKEEYSTLKPATSSAYAYGKSNGVLLVYASIEMKNIPAKGSSGTQYQTTFCDKTISLKLKLPAIIAIGIINKPSEI
jgi:hypothetical protein